MKKTRFYELCIVIAAVWGIAFAGCGQPAGMGLGTADTGIGQAGTETSTRSYLAMLKAQDNHKVSVENLQQIASGFVNKLTSDTPDGRTVSAENSVTGIRKLEVNNKNKFQNRNKDGRTLSAEPETEPVELYEFAFGNPADGGGQYALASNDVRIGYFLAMTEGSLADAGGGFGEYIRAAVQAYIDSIILVYNDITEAEVEAAIAEMGAETVPSRSVSVTGDYDGNPDGWVLESLICDFVSGRGFLLCTRWGQGTAGPYSDSTTYAYNAQIRHFAKANTGLYNTTEEDADYFVAGCGPVAMAQVIAYYGVLNSSTNKPGPWDDGTAWQGRGKWSGTYDFGLLQGSNTIAIRNNSNYIARGQVAALMFQAFRESKTTLVTKTDEDGNKSSYIGTSMDDIKTAMENFGYTTSYYSYATSAAGTSNSFSITYYTPLSVISTALDNALPIIAAGATSDNQVAHIWVIDGYGRLTWLNETYKKGNKFAYRRLTFNNCLMVHCNMGWDEEGDEGGFQLSGYTGRNGWYIYGIFDTRATAFDNKSITAEEGNYSSRTIMLIAKPK